MIRAAPGGEKAQINAPVNAINSLDGTLLAQPMMAEILRRDPFGPRNALPPMADGNSDLLASTVAGLVHGAEREDAALPLDLHVEPTARAHALACGRMIALARDAKRPGANSLRGGLDERACEALPFNHLIGARGEGPLTGDLVGGAALDQLAEMA